MAHSVRHRRDATPLIVVMMAVTFATVIGLIVVSAVFIHAPAQSQERGVSQDSDQLHATWKALVASLCSSLTPSSTDEEIQGVMNKVIALRVSAADRDAHLNLVLALGAWARREVGAAERVWAAMDAIAQSS